MHIPKFYHWENRDGSSVWAFGWETGRDNDLICVKRNVQTTVVAELALSPVCSTRLLAILAFAIKLILLGIDQNLRV